MRRVGQVMALAALMFSATFPVTALAQTSTTEGSVGSAIKASVMVTEQREVPISVTLSGRAVAVAEARIRPLIEGLVTEIAYQPGREISAGTVLFRIDPRSYQAELTRAEAALESARAAVPARRAAVDRAERLAGTGTTQATIDTAQMELRQAVADVSAAEAALDLARLNLERTNVTSPIDGVVSVPGVSVGDLVTAGQADTLATVTSLDPIHVDMSDSSARLLGLRDPSRNGEATAGAQLGVALTLENGEVFSGTGTIEAISSTVSTTTGTRSIRVRFANPERVILPGMFVRAKLTLGTALGVLVPQRSVDVNTDGTLTVWTLPEDGLATPITVNASGEMANSWVITAGLPPGTRVILDNLDRMERGRTILPVPAHVDADGLIVEEAAAATPAAAGN